VPIFVPRNPQQVLREMLGKVVNRTELSDVQVGSSLFTLLNAMAHEVANTEARMFNLRASFALENAEGEDLDARVAELPPIGISRKKSSNASGSVLKITRTGASALAGPTVIPIGSTISKSEDGTKYRTASTITIPFPDTSIDNVYVVCMSTGSSGNATTGAIDTIEGMPDEIIAVENTSPINNGFEVETDSSLRNRATRYINSLGRVGIKSLEFLGTSFISSENTSFSFAGVYEDPERPGYSELVVDDGSGLEDPGTRFSSPRSVTIGSGGARFLTHERPATKELTAGNISITNSDGDRVVLADNDFISIPERGILYFKSGVLTGGETVNISSVRLYSGAIAELQEEIEGNVNDGSVLTGFRAAGCRVRVSPPVKTDFEVKINIIVSPESDRRNVIEAVRFATVDFINDLDIGQELLPSQLSTHLMTTQNILSAGVFIRNTTTPMDKVFPASGKHVLRTSSDKIDVFTTN